MHVNFPKTQLHRELNEAARTPKLGSGKGEREGHKSCRVNRNCCHNNCI